MQSETNRGTPEPSCDAAMKAFVLMDEAFRSHKPPVWDRTQTSLIRTLLSGDDAVGQMAATWAVSWLVRPTEATQPPRLQKSLIDALVLLVNDENTEVVVWKRASATLGKMGLPSTDDRILLNWARSADGVAVEALGEKQGSKPLRISERRLAIGLDKAKRILRRKSDPPDVRRAAALLAQAFAKSDPSLIVDALKESALDEDMVPFQRKAFVIRLRQVGGEYAAEALVEVVRSRKEDAGVAAFLALCDMGKVALLNREDLEDSRYGSLFLDTRRRLISSRSRSSAGRQSAAAVSGSAVPSISSFVTRVTAGLGHLIHKLKAKDTTGRWAYYFILVTQDNEPAFLEAIAGDGRIDLEDYGTVVASCYGETPTPEVRDYLREKYGFTV